MTRLITFLGTGAYTKTRYCLDGNCHDTEFIAEALVHLLGVKECFVVATDKAWKTHGQALCERLSETVAFKQQSIPDGQSTGQLWSQFEALRDTLIQDNPTSVVLDITHGFRAQPFFAAGVLAQLSACAQLPEDTRVFYGEFDREKQESPIWDLSLFLDLLDWAQGTTVMRETGNGRTLVKLLEDERRRQAKQAAQAGQKRFPRTEPLTKAIEKFSDDLATVRVASLITGYEQEDSKKHKAVSSAQALLDAVFKYRDEVDQWLPVLQPFLEQLESVAQDLSATRLLGEEGVRAMQTLAQRYLDLGRTTEASIVMREGWISASAQCEAEVEVNSQQFSKAARERLEDNWREQMGNEAKSLARIRNDLQHGGFNEQPLAGKDLQQQVADWVHRFTGLKPRASEASGHSGNTYFVSRHPGAIEWAQRQGLAVDHQLPHLDVKRIMPGDVVIGSLPVNLAAEVCARGANYWHLSLDLPAEWRGRELSADDMERFGARLEQYRIVHGARS